MRIAPPSPLSAHLPLPTLSPLPVAARGPVVVSLRLLITAAALVTVLPACDEAPWSPPAPGASANDNGLAALGERIFRDTSLSEPAGQACATCHDPARGFSDGREGSPTSEGVVKGSFGRRNAPSAAYLAACPPFRFSESLGTFQGGLFWDGRVSSLEQQAQKPFLSPLEMNNADAAALVGKARTAAWAPEFLRLFGEQSLDNTDAAFDRMAQAIAAFERSSALQPFTSKYDYYVAGRARLSPSEARGLALFNDESKGNCAACHPSRPVPDSGGALFTDFTYDNIGIPKNPKSRFYSLPAPLNPEGAAHIDHGLAGVLHDPTHDGRFRVPTLRNIALTAPYGHNGYFADLESVVRFYNTRDSDPMWPPPEVPGTINRDELGDLGLTDDEVADLVAFLKTLTDGYAP